MKKKIWVMVITVLIIIISAKIIYDMVYISRARTILQDIGIDTSNMSDRDIEKLLTLPETDAKITYDTYECQEEKRDANMTGYIILLGFGTHDIDKYQVEREQILSDDTNSLSILDFNESKHLDEIAETFYEELQDFFAREQPDELIIIAESAGGVVVLSTPEKLDLGIPIEVHTIASPLKGYGLRDGKEVLVGDRTGFEQEIALGFLPFSTPPENVEVFHHKELTTSLDEHSLLSWCGAYVKFCNILEIQNNNVIGSHEFYYEGYDHRTIMHHAAEKIIRCHNGGNV